MMKRLLSWFRKPKKSPQDPSNLVENVLQKLIHTDVEEISCNDVHELIDQFSELKTAGEDVEHLMPLMQRHLDLCPDCLEEHEALMQAIKYEKSIEDEF